MSWNLTVSTGDNPQTWDINAESPIDPLNISVENNEVNIILSIEEEAASTALVAAARAEEAKAETLTLAGSALAIANASIQAKTESVAAKNLSENARDISIQKASEAGTSEANSLANKNASIQAKTDAETAANTATNQAEIATQKASEAGTSEANSLANKNASIQAKTDSEAASAIAVTQAGIATTKATEAATSEANSLANKNAAIQAKTDSEAASVIATAQAVIATTKAGDAGTSEANSLANKNAAIEAKATAETKAAEALASATASNAAKVIAEAKSAEALNSATASNAAKVIAETKAVESATSATNAATSESNALTYKNQAEGFKNNSQTILTDIQALLPNFPKPSVFALNKRGIAESATFARKLKPVNNTVKALEALNPSLVLDPSVIKAGKLFSVIPDDGTGDFTVSRNGTGTYLGSNGLLKTAQPNEPRLEFNTDGTFKGVLVEPSATNLLSRSEEFENARWIKQKGLISTNIILSPNNTLTADLFTEDTSLGNHKLLQGNVINALGNYTFSGYIKSNGRDILIREGNSTLWGARFNLEAGTVSQLIGDATTATINRNSDGWCYVTVSFVFTFQVNFTLLYSLYNNITRSDYYLGNGVSGVYIWGAQLEVGSVATSYIPTVASTVTRPADVIQKTGIADLIGQTEGSVYLDFILARRGSDIFFFHPRTSNNMIISVTSDGRFLASFYNQSVAITFTPSFINNVGQRVKVLFKYKSNDIKFFANGQLLSQNLTTTINLTQVLSDITLNASGAIFVGLPYKIIKSFSLFKTALTDAQAIALTTL